MKPHNSLCKAVGGELKPLLQVKSFAPLVGGYVQDRGGPNSCQLYQL